MTSIQHPSKPVRQQSVVVMTKDMPSTSASSSSFAEASSESIVAEASSESIFAETPKVRGSSLKQDSTQEDKDFLDAFLGTVPDMEFGPLPDASSELGHLVPAPLRIKTKRRPKLGDVAATWLLLNRLLSGVDVQAYTVTQTDQSFQDTNANPPLRPPRPWSGVIEFPSDDHMAYNLSEATKNFKEFCANYGFVKDAEKFEQFCAKHGIYHVPAHAVVDEAKMFKTDIPGWRFI